MNRKTFLYMMDGILEESNKIKKLKKKMAKTANAEKKEEILGEISGLIYQLKIHCNVMDEKLDQVQNWHSMPK